MAANLFSDLVQQLEASACQWERKRERGDVAYTYSLEMRNCCAIVYLPSGTNYPVTRGNWHVSIWSVDDSVDQFNSECGCEGFPTAQEAMKVCEEWIRNYGA